MVEDKNALLLNFQNEILSLVFLLAVLRGAGMQSLQNVQDNGRGNTYFLTGHMCIIFCVAPYLLT